MMNCLQGLSPIRACSLLTSIDGPKRAFVGGTRAGPVLCTADALCPDVTTSGYIIPNPWSEPDGLDLEESTHLVHLVVTRRSPDGPRKLKSLNVKSSALLHIEACYPHTVSGVSLLGNSARICE